MMKKNDIDIEGDVNSNGDINIGNTIETQNNLVIINDPNQLVEYVKKDVELMLEKQQLVSEDRAREKLEKFSERLLPKLVRAELIDAFKDPAIQIFFREEQKTALCSDRDIDMSLLSEMLVYRISNKNNISKKASVSKAVEVIDKITTDALMALTIKYLINFFPITGNIIEGLKVLDDLYKFILEENTLPINSEWLDNAEILGVVRVNSLTTLKRFEERLSEKLEGYCLAGIQKDTQRYNEIIETLEKNNIPTGILVDHVLNQNYVRINVVDLERIDSISIIKGKIMDGKQVFTEEYLTQNQKQILKDIYNETLRDKSRTNHIKEQLVLKIKEYPSLNTVMEWWNNNLSPAVSLNSVGNVIAHTNAKKLRDDIPDMV